MYSVVLLVAATSGGDMAGFGHKDSGGCTGYVAGCTGCDGGGFLGLRSKHQHGCDGGCHGSAPSTGCGGGVFVGGCSSSVPTVAPSMGCTGSNGCDGGGSGFLGLRSGGGMFGKHKHGCGGGCSGG